MWPFASALRAVLLAVGTLLPWITERAEAPHTRRSADRAVDDEMRIVRAGSGIRFAGVPLDEPRYPGPPRRWNGMDRAFLGRWTLVAAIVASGLALATAIAVLRRSWKRVGVLSWATFGAFLPAVAWTCVDLRGTNGLTDFGTGAGRTDFGVIPTPAASGAGLLLSTRSLRLRGRNRRPAPSPPLEVFE